MTVEKRRYGHGWPFLILLTLVLTGCGGDSNLSDSNTNRSQGYQASQESDVSGGGPTGSPGQQELVEDRLPLEPGPEPEPAIENPVLANPIKVPEDADPEVRDPVIADPEQDPAPGPESDPVADRPVLQWDSPLTREDGSKLFPGEVSGYRIYYRLRHQDDYKSVVVDGPDSTSLELDEFRSGAYEFAVSTVDSDGLESRRSEAIPVDII